MKKIFGSLRAVLKKPANDFVLMTLLTPLPCILLAPESRWVSVAVLAYAILMGRVYGADRWLSGFAKGREIISQHSQEEADPENNTIP
ncbi:hypothetical protein IFT48_02780 [Pseudomonas fluorescens]|uniref:hypothetical protein n=1 Tax=Pseudomonas fluorescens TaxID=294 RepID=UPI0019309969|nr:hypothetical protein [Pseudomonas fluorescens]MBD8088891.1 hypothetical protein [Pseudomonas fluorescens]